MVPLLGASLLLLAKTGREAARKAWAKRRRPTAISGRDRSGVHVIGTCVRRKRMCSRRCGTGTCSWSRLWAPTRLSSPPSSSSSAQGSASDTSSTSLSACLRSSAARGSARSQAAWRRCSLRSASSSIRTCPDGARNRGHAHPLGYVCPRRQRARLVRESQQGTIRVVARTRLSRLSHRASERPLLRRGNRSPDCARCPLRTSSR